MQVDLHVWGGVTRPCRFCLSLQNCAVYADFDVDDSGKVFALRASFDGYGCCHVPSDRVSKMNDEDSRRLLAMVEKNVLDEEVVHEILRRYFNANRTLIWEDALEEHGLV